MLPTLRLLRRALPGARLALVGSPWAEQLLPLMPDAPEFVRFDSAALTGLFTEDPESDASGVFSGADLVVLYTSQECGALARNARRFCRGPVLVWRVTPAGGIHAACHLASAVAQGCDGPGDLPFPVLRVPHRATRWAKEWLAGQGGLAARPLAAIHPGSGGRRKCWPAARFARLVQHLHRQGFGILLIEGPADREACSEICRGLPPGGILMPGVQSLERCAALMSGCCVYVGNDSGVTHMAAALGVPSVAIFGPTEPAVWSPLGRKVRVCGAAGGKAGRWPALSEVLAQTEDLLGAERAGVESLSAQSALRDCGGTRGPRGAPAR